MSGRTVSVDQLSEAVLEELEEYNELAADTVKESVKKAGTTVRNQIKETAPRLTGRYARSWASKTTAESSTSIPHIAPAEKAGEEQLLNDIEKALKG